MTLYPAYAKLNLTLDVLSRREDGYHELDMLNIRVTLADGIAFSPADTVDIAYENAPVAAGGTVQKAVEAYARLAGRPYGAAVRVKKRIPAEAGLGGGSADAAAVLNAMQAAYGALSDVALYEAALSVGADVPYCLQDAPCRVGGVGEKLVPLSPPRAPLWFVLVKPAAGVSTAALFARLALPVRHPQTERALSSLESGDAEALGGLVQNALQEAAAELIPEIGALSLALLRKGALGASMTGSGSAVFGLFETEARARRAAQNLPGAAFVSVCRSL